MYFYKLKYEQIYTISITNTIDKNTTRSNQIIQNQKKIVKIFKLIMVYQLLD